MRAAWMSTARAKLFIREQFWPKQRPNGGGRPAEENVGNRDGIFVETVELSDGVFDGGLEPRANEALEQRCVFCRTQIQIAHLVEESDP